MTAWQGIKPAEAMRADQLRTLKLQGYTQDGEIWRGKYYDARATDRPCPPNPDGTFDGLVIEYFSKQTGT